MNPLNIQRIYGSSKVAWCKGGKPRAKMKFCEGAHANGDGLANNIIIERGKAAAHRGWGFVFLPFVVACINGK